MPKNKKAGRSPTETPLAKIARIDPGKRITNEFYEKFFVGGKLSAIQVQCFVCGEVRSTCGNTTNAKVHVITNHLDVITDFLQSGKRVNQFDVEKHDSFKNLPASRPAPVAEMTNKDSTTIVQLCSEDEDDPEISSNQTLEVLSPIHENSSASNNRPESMEKHFPTLGRKTVFVKTKQLTLQQMIERASCRAVDMSYTHKQMNGFLKFLVATGSPLSNLDDESISELFKSMNPRVTKELIPTAQEVRQHRTSKVEDLMKLATKTLNNQLITVMVYVEEVYKDNILVLIQLSCLDTSNNSFFSPCADTFTCQMDELKEVLKPKMEAALDRFQIHDLCKVISVICNWSEIEECLVNIFPNVLCTSPDMLQILKNFHSEFKSSPSLLELTQKLNQMQDFLKTNDEALVKLQEKCSNLVIMNEDREMLETEQNEENVSNLPDPKLFVSCVDYFDQLSLFVNLTPAFKELFDSEDVFLLCPAQFTNLDLKSAQEVMQFVEIFSDVGKIVKSDDLFNLSQVLPFVAILGNSIRQVECKTYIGMEVKDKLVDFSKKLEERYLEKKILTNAMSFDPRYKMSILKPNVAGLLLMSYKSKLNHEVKSSPREEPPIRQNAVTSSSSSRTLVSFRFSDHVANQTRPSSLSDEQVAEAELLMFFRNKIVDDVCYVKYWQDRLASQKHLSKFALKRLVVPGKMQISSLKKISHSVFSWDRSYENWSSFFLFTLKNYF